MKIALAVLLLLAVLAVLLWHFPWAGGIFMLLVIVAAYWGAYRDNIRRRF